MDNYPKIIPITPLNLEHCTVIHQKDADEMANSEYLDQIDLGLQCLLKIYLWNVYCQRVCYSYIPLLG